MQALYSKPLLHSSQIFAPKQNLFTVYTKRRLGNLKYNSLRLTFYYPATDAQILSYLSECNVGQDTHFFKMQHESSWLKKRAISKPTVSSELIKQAFIVSDYLSKDTNTGIVSRALSELFQILKTTKENLNHTIDSSATLFLADLCCRLKEAHKLQNINQLISYLEHVLQHPALFKGWSTTDTTLNDCIIYTLGKLNSIRQTLKIYEQKDSAIDILKEIEHHLSQMILPELLSAIITLTTQGTQVFLLTTYFDVKNNCVAPDMNLSHFPEINRFIKSEIGAYLSPLLEQIQPILHGNKEFTPKDLSQDYHSAFSSQFSGLHPVFKQVALDALSSEITQLMRHLNTLLHFWKETVLLEATAKTLGNDKFYPTLSNELVQFYIHFINLRERIKHSCEIIEHIGLIAQNHTTSWVTRPVSTWSYCNVQQAKQLFQQALKALDQCLLQVSSLLLKQKQHSAESSAIKERNLLMQLEAVQSKASSLLGLEASTQKKLPSEKELKAIIETHNIQILSSNSFTSDKPAYASETTPFASSFKIIRLLKWCFKPFKNLWNLLFRKHTKDPSLAFTALPSASTSSEILPFSEEDPHNQSVLPVCEDDRSMLNTDENLNVKSIPKEAILADTPNSDSIDRQETLSQKKSPAASCDELPSVHEAVVTTELSLEALKILALRFLKELSSIDSKQTLSEETQARYYQQLSSAQKEETIYCRLAGFINETKAHKAICDTQLKESPYNTTLQIKLLEFEARQQQIKSKLLSDSIQMGMYGVAPISFFPNTRTENAPSSSFIHASNNRCCRCIR